MKTRILKEKKGQFETAQNGLNSKQHFNDDP